MATAGASKDAIPSLGWFRPDYWHLAWPGAYELHSLSVYLMCCEWKNARQLPKNCQCQRATHPCWLRGPHGRVLVEELQWRNLALLAALPLPGLVAFRVRSCLSHSVMALRSSRRPVLQDAPNSPSGFLPDEQVLASIFKLSLLPQPQKSSLVDSQYHTVFNRLNVSVGGAVLSCRSQSVALALLATTFKYLVCLYGCSTLLLSPAAHFQPPGLWRIFAHGFANNADFGFA